MDVVTLALAESKVDNAASKAVETSKEYADRAINLTDYGIDLPAIVLAGGGIYQYTDKDLLAKFDSGVQRLKPVYAVVPFQGIEFRCVVSALSAPDNAHASVGFSLSIIYQDVIMITGNVQVQGGSVGLNVYAHVTTAQLSPLNGS